MSRKGFTLIELLVVISIISLLASVVLASLNSARDKGRLGGAKYFATQVDHIESDQAVGIWDFSECSGTAASDRSGNGNNGTLTAGPTWSTDTPFGTGCSLSFSGGNYVAVPAVTTEALGNNPFTVSIWLKQSSYQSRACMIATTNYLVGGWMLCQGYSASDGKLFFERNVSGGSDIVSAPNPIPLNVWVYMTAVYDNVSTKLSIYQDGALVASALSTGASGAPNSLRIGSTWQGGWGGYTGLLDSARVFGKALTASEVGRLYALERQRFASANK